MEFFNFGSKPTYWFFNWSIRSKSIDIDTLIDEAIERFEGAWHVEGDLCVSHEGLVTLTGVLDELLDSVVGGCDLDLRQYECTPEDEMCDTTEGLCIAVLRNALDEIDTRAVAEAILIRAGKWNNVKLRMEWPAVDRPKHDPGHD